MVRYIVNFNNGSTTGPNGVSEFILTAHMWSQWPVDTTKHSPAERREREREPEIMPLSLPDSRSQVLSRTTNSAAQNFSSGNVVYKYYKCHANAHQKNGNARCAHCFL
jgi:hypothetical protein